MGGALEIRSLEGLDSEVLTRVFNEAFADYVIEFQATREFKEFRWALARVDWELSLGAFDGDRLVGFCYHGLDEIDGRRVAYNSGTGVVPEYRGRALVDRLYEASWPLFRRRGIERCTLEVIAGNHRAIRVYERIGFQVQRELVYMKGRPKGRVLRRSAAAVVPQELPEPPWEQLAELETVHPAWDFMLGAAKAQGDGVRVMGVQEADRLVAAAILRDLDCTLCWLSVASDRRRRGLASALLESADSTRIWRMVNVDRGAVDLLGFLRHAGLEEEMFQYEMVVETPPSDQLD